MTRSRVGLKVAIALGCVCLFPGGAAAQVEGRVVDPSGVGLGAEVTLEVHDGQQVIYSMATRSAEDGSVAWADAPTGDGFHGRLRGTVDGAEYISATTALTADASPLELVIVPVATDGRPLHLDTLHLIVQSDDAAVLRVLQFMTVSNAAEAPWAGGPALEDGRRAGLVVPVPVEATNVQPAPFPTPDAALDVSQAQFGSDRILDARPVPISGRQVAITYELPIGGGAIDTELLLPYPAAAVTLMIGGAARETLEVASGTLTLGEPDMIGEEEYDLWHASALSPGTAIDIRIGPPGFRLDLGQVGVLGGGAALLLAVAGSLFSTRRPAQVSRDRSAIIASIAALDDNYDTGDLSAGDYFKRRSRELERLALLEQSRGTSGTA